MGERHAGGLLAQIRCGGSEDVVRERWAAGGYRPTRVSGLFFLTDVPSAVASVSPCVTDVVRRQREKRRRACGPPSIHLHLSLRADRPSWIVHVLLLSVLLLTCLQRKGTTGWTRLLFLAPCKCRIIFQSGMNFNKTWWKVGEWHNEEPFKFGRGSTFIMLAPRQSTSPHMLKLVSL